MPSTTSGVWSGGDYRDYSAIPPLHLCKLGLPVVAMYIRPLSVGAPRPPGQGGLGVPQAVHRRLSREAVRVGLQGEGVVQLQHGTEVYGPGAGPAAPPVSRPGSPDEAVHVRVPHVVTEHQQGLVDVSGHTQRLDQLSERAVSRDGFGLVTSGRSAGCVLG